jgi:G3E family GTPase
VCCAVRGDLVLTLEDLLRRRDSGSVPLFERVVIETSGLADPAPILHAVMSDAGLARRLVVAGVVATVDAINGLQTLAAQPESVKQVALADRLILTKTDLSDDATGDLRARLAALNPSAALITASFGRIDPERLFDMGLRGAAPKLADLGAWLGPEPPPHAHDSHGHHDSEITCIALVHDTPMRAITLTLLLEILAEHCGGDLLRLKGIINVVESPDRPAVIHGVQHVFHPPAWLDRWPSEDRRSRLVLIGRNLSRAWVESLIEALDAEVTDVLAAG